MSVDSRTVLKGPGKGLPPSGGVESNITDQFFLIVAEVNLLISSLEEWET